MFSTFLETHCGLVFRGKGLGGGSAQWNSQWLGGPRIKETFIERPLCTSLRDSQMLKTLPPLQKPHYLVMDTDSKHEKLKTDLKTKVLVTQARSLACSYSPHQTLSSAD